MLVSRLRLLAGLICLSILAFPASAHVTGILFGDNFGNSSTFSDRWSETLNTGSVSFTGDGLSLHSSATGLPVIQTVTNPFPTYDWSVSFGYRYSTIGNYGTGIGCTASDGSAVFKIHQDINAQLVQMNGHNVLSSRANTDWHVFTVVKDGPMYEAYMDGVKVGQDDVKLIPAAITIGGSQQANPWDWNNIDVQFVRVYAGHVVLDKTDLMPTQDPTPPSSAPGLPPSFRGISPMGGFMPGTQITPFKVDRNPADVARAQKQYDDAEKATAERYKKDHPISYDDVVLSAFPINEHTSYILNFEVENDTDDTTFPDLAPYLHFNDGTEVMLMVYDPLTSSIANGGFVNPSPLPAADLGVPAHSKKSYRAFGFDSGLVNANYGDPDRYESNIAFDQFGSGISVPLNRFPHPVGAPGYEHRGTIEYHPAERSMTLDEIVGRYGG